MPTLDDAQNSPVNPESTSSQPVAPNAPVESALVESALMQVGRPATPLEEQAWDPDAHAEQEAIRAQGSNGSGGYSGGGNDDNSGDEGSADEPVEGKMSFLDHLEELRRDRKSTRLNSSH